MKSELSMIEFTERALSTLMPHMVEKIEGDTKDGKVKVYWCGTIIRIDFRPQSKSLVTT